MGIPDTTKHKPIIYQLLPRLFGNTKTVNKTNGTIEENGTGKFNDITDKALRELANMGITHIWYAGVIEHATMTDYSFYGIKADDPDVVKGIAGSPYAIKDYYDVDPDLATDVNGRMGEYEDLIRRTRRNGLKVIMDFVPNHVARTYSSDAKPVNVRDFGEDDDKSKAFDPENDFYYLPGQAFTVPANYNAGGDGFTNALKDGKFEENPARATGNNCFNAAPALTDWFETVKLNYGVDIINGGKTYFDPIPPLWTKLYDILMYWSAKGVDGFRCDMVEYVPSEFWGWLIPKLKTVYPQLIFIGEAYQAKDYSSYIFNGKFDYLYDKVGIYDAIKRLTRNQPEASVWDINKVWNNDTKGIDKYMLRFMENHDEERIASANFAGNPWYAVPGMLICATLSNGPVMIYFGQETGEPGEGIEGFGDNDARTSIFDYWGVPEHQKWMNNGLYDGALLTDSQKGLRNFYSKLLTIAATNEALYAGEFYELLLANQHQDGFDERIYIYLRYTKSQRVLVIANFDRKERMLQTKFPDDLLMRLSLTGPVVFKDLLSERMFSTENIAANLSINIPAMSGVLLAF